MLTRLPVAVVLLLTTLETQVRATVANSLVAEAVYDRENRNALPAIDFNHCILEVGADHNVPYLDLTAENYPLGSAPLRDIPEEEVANKYMCLREQIDNSILSGVIALIHRTLFFAGTR